MGIYEGPSRRSQKADERRQHRNSRHRITYGRRSAVDEGNVDCGENVTNVSPRATSNALRQLASAAHSGGVRKAIAVAWAFVLVPTISASEPTPTIQVDNVVAMPADVLQLAENRAGEAFHKIGVQVRWVDTRTAARDHIVAMFALVLVNVNQSRGPYFLTRHLWFRSADGKSGVGILGSNRCCQGSSPGNGILL